MQKRSIWILTILLLVIVGGVFQLVTRKAKAPVLVSRTDPPKISFEERSHDLGHVEAGNEIPFVFKIHNVGGEPLIIHQVNAHCECALLNLKDKFIEPGKIGELEVILDTAETKGELSEAIEIFSNDPERPRTRVFLAATIDPPPLKMPQEKTNPSATQAAMGDNRSLTLVNAHAGLADKGQTRLFKGQCATCHVLQGRGKLGGDLYQADCAMCHGQNAEGGLAPALAPGNYHDMAFLGRFQQIVRYGGERHDGLPGFHKEAGGPLSDAEIHSIVLYLQNKSDQAKSRQSDVPGG